MVENARERLVVDDLPGYEPNIGRLLWMLENTRQRTIEWLEDLSGDDLAWTPGPAFNSIGTILYHLAAIEADWLYVEVVEQPFPPAAIAHFSNAVRDDAGRLTDMAGEDLETLLCRLVAVRGLLLDTFRGMPLSEFRRVRSLPDYDVTPEYVLHHLMQHEAEHRGEIGMLRVLAAQGRGAAPAR